MIFGNGELGIYIKELIRIGPKTSEEILWFCVFVDSAEPIHGQRSGDARDMANLFPIGTWDQIGQRHLVPCNQALVGLFTPQVVGVESPPDRHQK